MTTIKRVPFQKLLFITLVGESLKKEIERDEGIPNLSLVFDYHRAFGLLQKWSFAI